MNKVNNGFDHEAVFARMRAEAKDRRDREERAEQRAIDGLRLDMTSLGQQFTGISVICTFIASMDVALLSLANELYQDTNGGGIDSSSAKWGRWQIYLMWYLALVYSLTTAIAAGASAVFAFARANGRLEGEAQGRVTADRARMGHLVRGYGICFSVAVTMLFAGLLFFIWAAHDRWITILVGIAVLPLWAWLLSQAYREWYSTRGWEAGGSRTWRLWATIPWSSWSTSRWRKESKEKEDGEAV